MVAASKRYQDSLISALQDPKEAVAYVKAALEAGDRAAYVLAIRNVARLKEWKCPGQNGS